MNTQYSYQHYQARQAEELRKVQQHQLAQQAQSAQPTATVYNVALAQVGRTLVAVGQRLQQRPEVRPMPRKA